MSMVAAAKQVLINNGCDLNDIRYCIKTTQLKLYSFLMF